MESPMEFLLGGVSDGEDTTAVSSGGDQAKTSSRGIRPGRSFVQAAKAPIVSEVQHQVGPHGGWTVVCRKGRRDGQQRSSASSCCSRCLRPGHKAPECKHLLTCRRCKGSGHIATYCPVKSPVVAPFRETLPSNTQSFGPRPAAVNLSGKLSSVSRLSTISIPLSPELLKAKNDLKRVFVLSVTSGIVNDSELQAVLPLVLKLSGKINVQVFRRDTFLLTVLNSDDVKILEKSGDCVISASSGSLFISQWSPEIGSVCPATGTRSWVHVWNLPFHCWGWTTVASILHQLGALVTISKGSAAPPRALRALLRLHGRSLLPHELELNVGMRKFLVLVTDENSEDPIFSGSKQRYLLGGGEDGVQPSSRVFSAPPVRRFTHDISKTKKGKASSFVGPPTRKRKSESSPEDVRRVSILHHVLPSQAVRSNADRRTRGKGSEASPAEISPTEEPHQPVTAQPLPEDTVPGDVCLHLEPRIQQKSTLGLQPIVGASRQEWRRKASEVASSDGLIASVGPSAVELFEKKNGYLVLASSLPPPFRIRTLYADC